MEFLFLKGEILRKNTIGIKQILLFLNIQMCLPPRQMFYFPAAREHCYEDLH